MRVVSPDEVDTIERVYRDVQGFARHADEKLRSLMTALSFLTAAGIALFVFASTADVSDLRFDGYSANVANVFFVAFLLSVALSLSSALVAMDPTAHRPHFLRGQRRNVESLLYYESILKDPWWQSSDPVDVDHLRRRLFDSYKRDTYELARRARHKVARMQNAEALMGLALVALLVVGIARLPDSGADVRTWLVIGCLLLFTASPFVTYFRMRHAEFPALAGTELKANRGNLARLAAFYLLPTVVASVLACLCLFGGRAHWPCVAFAAGWIGIGRLASFWRHGYWIGLVVSLAAIPLIYVLASDASVLRAETSLTLQLSHARQVVGDESRTLVCARVRGGHARAEVELRLDGGPTSPDTPIKLRLSDRGSRAISFEALPAAHYTGEARELPDPNVVSSSTDTPPVGQLGEPALFECPPLEPAN